MKRPIGRTPKPEPPDSEDARTRSWIARAIVAVALGTFVGTLVFVAGDRESVKTILTNSHGLLLLVLGYYFGKRS